MSTTQPLSIALVIRRLAGRGGGAERIYCELANLLVDMGYDVTCIHCEWSREEPAFALDPKVRRVNLWHRSSLNPGLPALLRVLSLGYRDGKLWAPVAWLSKHGPFVWLLTRYFSRTKPDVVVALMPNAITPSLIAGTRTGTKVIASNHNAPEQDYQSTEKWDQNPIDRSIRRKLLKKAVRVHVLLDDYAQFFPPEIRRKIEVIHNYPSDDVGLPDATEPREKLILGVGRLAPVKNFRVLVDAWAELASEFPDWRVEIYGKGEEEGLLADQIKSLGLGGSVHLKGQTDRIVAAYQRASLLAHPALYEGFPLSVTEALACGVPVVAFAKTSGVSQLVFDGINGQLVERARGAEGFAESLRLLMSSPLALAAQREAAPGSVQKYSKMRYAERWREVIESVAREPTFEA
jgi:glycosyltransferase involved in cell wall biosynthesis